MQVPTEVPAEVPAEDDSCGATLDASGLGRTLQSREWWAGVWESCTGKYWNSLQLV